MQDPSRYESNKSAGIDVVNTFLPKIVNTMKWATEEKILDYGCGAGSTGYDWILPEVKKRNSRMYSLDMSDKMIAYAKEHYSHDQIIYGVGNILGTFPFENEKFDKIVSINVLHFIRNIRGALAGFHKILKPGGQLGFTSPTAEFWIFQAFKELSNTETWKPFMKEYVEDFYPEWAKFSKGQERNGMKELLEYSGFRVIELAAVQMNYHFGTTETFLDLALSINPCLDKIPTNLYEKFKLDLRKKFTRYAGIPVDSKSIDWPYIIVWGVIEKFDK